MPSGLTGRELASRLGLKTADAITRPRSKPDRAAEIEDAVKAVARRRTEFERKAEKDLGIAVVAIIGHAERVTRPGRNEGGRAIAVKTSADPRLVYMDEDRAYEHGLAQPEDRQQPFIETAMVELARVYVQSDAHAERLKAALDSVLIGNTVNARHRWRDVPEEFDMDFLPLLIGQAAEDARVAVFDAAERDRRKRVRVKKLMKGARGEPR